MLKTPLVPPRYHAPFNEALTEIIRRHLGL
jgi:hypothetical protein